MNNIGDLYKYALLATASYVRTGGSTDTGDFIDAASAADENRLPLSIAQYLFDPPAGSSVTPWTIAYYHGSDNTTDPFSSESKSGFAATLFQKDGENVLAVRGVEPTLGFTELTQSRGQTR